MIITQSADYRIIPPYAQKFALRLTRAILHRHAKSDGDHLAEVWGVDDIPELSHQLDLTAFLALALERQIEKAEASGTHILNANRTQLKRVAESLIDRRELSGELFGEILHGEKFPPTIHCSRYGDR